jgi:hypothetical protein
MCATTARRSLTRTKLIRMGTLAVTRVNPATADHLLQLRPRRRNDQSRQPIDVEPTFLTGAGKVLFSRKIRSRRYLRASGRLHFKIFLAVHWELSTIFAPVGTCKPATTSARPGRAAASSSSRAATTGYSAWRAPQTGGTIELAAIHAGVRLRHKATRKHSVQMLATGPAAPVGSTCGAADIDCNGYADLRDFAAFQRSLGSR